ncbi:14343_t:CDS:10 [Entrophospora sp. SA101]|nr:14343_t:CDS:10 [Entrophospora sp. SA101]CAJ0831627.1 7099_t:CDS:10 [Entrophospora sp. SA101]
MAFCPHVSTVNLQPPSASTQVHKEECTLCFDSQDLSPGIDVCLTCFNASCPGPERNHSQIHYQKTNHPLVLNIRRLIKDKPKRPDENEEPPQKISKLAIVPESEEEKYEFLTKVKCHTCDGVEVDKTLDNLPFVIDSIMLSISANRQSEIKAWEEEITACEHTQNLVQEPPKALESQNFAHCKDCDLKENLWLCLVCGNIGCGRQQYGGISGNGHGLAHFESTNHQISCKLGTITPEGTADIYCYVCNDMKLDNEVVKHLANFGINIESQQKTEKSITELQLEQNLKFDFSMVTEDGKELEPLSGPGYTGIKNLGNSCYMASVLQSVFSLANFQERYFPTAYEHYLQCTQEPANCIQCQLSKIADGLLSGRYSNSNEKLGSEDDKREDNGIKPAMFKTLIGKGHEEFSTMRQQDAFEFLQYLITTIERKEHNNPKNDPTRSFKFSIQQRLQCLECKGVRYKNNTESYISVPVPAKRIAGIEENAEDRYEPVTIEECLDSYTADSIIEYFCPACNKKASAITNTKFLSFPEILIIHARRFELVNWVPRKISVPILFKKDTLTFDKYLAKGRQENETLLPEESSTGNQEPSINESDLNQLLLMGFPEIRCKKALIVTGNNGADVAMNWLFEHMDDPDIDIPMTINNNSGKRAVEWLFSHNDDDDISTENSTMQQSPNSNDTYGDSSLPATYKLHSVISHKGTSVHCGHYVAHVRKSDQWVLFNDNKVVAAPNPPIEDSYIYVLERILVID